MSISKSKKFKQLIEYHADFGNEWYELNNDEKLSLVFAYMDLLNESDRFHKEDDNEITINVSTISLRNMFDKNITEKEIKTSIYDNLIDSYEDIIQEKLHEQIEYNKNPDAYIQELKNHIDSWNQENRAYKFGFAR